MQKQISASVQARRTGLLIQHTFPQISDDYREGLTHARIVTKHSLDKYFEISYKNACIAVGFAIRGNNGQFGVREYQGLITDTKELERLCSEHRRKSARNLDQSIYRAAGLAGARALNRTVWTDSILTKDEYAPSEDDFAYRLSLLEDYRRGKLVNNKKIAQQLNDVFHTGREIRTAKSISAKLNSRKK
jgi:predicted DNA-binding WGR domain protein